MKALKRDIKSRHTNDTTYRFANRPRKHHSQDTIQLRCNRCLHIMDVEAALRKRSPVQRCDRVISIFRETMPAGTTAIVATYPRNHHHMVDDTGMLVKLDEKSVRTTLIVFIFVIYANCTKV